MACTAKTRLPTAELAQKLRWRKATFSNFCDKVFVGYETLLSEIFLPELQLSRRSKVLVSAPLFRHKV
jgi:hypothetical protein